MPLYFPGYPPNWLSRASRHPALIGNPQQSCCFQCTKREQLLVETLYICTCISFICCNWTNRAHDWLHGHGQFWIECSTSRSEHWRHTLDSHWTTFHSGKWRRWITWEHDSAESHHHDVPGKPLLRSLFRPTEYIPKSKWLGWNE